MTLTADDGAPGWEWIDDLEHQQHAQEQTMTIMIKESGGGDFKRVPPGTYAARCGLLADIGTQIGGPFGPKRTLVARFEVHDEETGEPLSVSRFWNLSLNEKAALRHDLESWRGRPFTAEELKGFDVEAVLSAPCMLSVIQTDEGKERIASIAKMPKGLEAPVLSHEPIRFSVSDEHPDLSVLPEWLQTKVQESIEWAQLRGDTPAAVAETEALVARARSGAAPDEDLDDDIPF